ncbi:MAG: hypothetical protein M3Z05_12720 [Gemmatimonadota bacterium]|nr:hypothetical protein [Gemmatimonadota bacterium]
MQTSLASKPNVLFLLFGDTADPRLLPVATLAGGRVKPLVLDAAAWRRFDSLYFATGAHFPLYRQGTNIGDAVVRRGMWDGNDALYKLPGCQALRPLAAVTLTGKPISAVMLELLATSDTVSLPQPRVAIVKADLDSAEASLVRIAQHEGLTSSARGELDEQTLAVATGATAHPTLIGSYLERGSGVNGKPRHLFEISDYSDSTQSYTRSFLHVPADSVREFRRLIDHVDLTGDGVDEIVLEGWKLGSDSFLMILQFANGRWHEVARGATSWCADKPV